MVDLFGTIEHTLKGAWRMGQTTATLLETGFSWILGDRPPAPALLRKIFEKLGSTYIKLGQFIASSPSIFPGEYVQEFEKCLDQTEPLPYSTVRRILRQELGHNLDAIFERIDEKPLASASIAQVHTAKLRTGEEVVLKVQKPGVEDALLTDLNFLYVSARILEWLAPGFARTSLAGIIEDIQKTMMEECDFLKEAENIKEFDTFLKDNKMDHAAVPHVYEKYTTLRVLTMERFYGVPLTDLESIRKYSDNPEMTLVQAMNTWFASLMQCNFFHADVHAGNLMVLEDGRIGFIDFGIVGRIHKHTWRSMNDLMESMATQDFRKMANAMLGIGATKNEVDLEAFSGDLETMFKGMQKIEQSVMQVGIEGMGSLIDDHELNRLMIDIVQVGERHGIRFPREFALLMKQFLYFDRYVRILAPGMDIFSDQRLMRLAD